MQPRRAALTAGIWLSLTVGAAAQAHEYVQVGELRATADIVEARGTQAYLVHGRSVTVVDLSNPAAPRQGGTHTFPDKVWGIRAAGSLLYAAVDKFGLGILDTSQASAPKLRGSVKTPGQSKSVAIVGSMALVADHMAGVNFIDVSDPTKPQLRGDFFLDGYARAVASSGSIAVAVDSPTGVYVFDLSKPSRLEPISTQQSAERPGNVELSEIPDAAGRRLAVLVGSGALQIYDVTDPAKPIKAATFRTPSGRPLDVALRGTTAFVADSTAGLQIVDLSTPAAPKIIGSFKTPASARSVALTEGLIVVAVTKGPVPASGESPEGTEGTLLVLAGRDRKP
jgi:hypothetical protein